MGAQREWVDAIYKYIFVCHIYYNHIIVYGSSLLLALVKIPSIICIRTFAFHFNHMQINNTREEEWEKRKKKSAENHFIHSFYECYV